MTLLRLKDSQITRIQSLKPQFMRAQGLTGVPWQALAAVWYRESFSVTPPRTPGGPFQFDPVPPFNRLASLLTKYTMLRGVDVAYYANKGVNDFGAGCIFCACWLRNKVEPVLSLTSPDALIKDAMWHYNGAAYGSADNSPYVMNFYDDAHTGPDGKGMHFSGSLPDKSQPDGRKEVSGTDSRPGAFTVYRQLIDLGV